MEIDPDPLFDEASEVASRSDFVRFLRNLNSDYVNHRENWSNDSLSAFLDGLSSFANDINGYYENMGEKVDSEQISWRMAAQMILAATIYE